MKDRKPDLSRNHMPWVKGRTDNARFFESKPIEIDATPEVVWEFVNDIENYDKYSKGKITAHVEDKDKQPEVNKTIAMDLYKDECLGKFIPTSRERISVVDEGKKTLGWERVLPANGGITERYQVLESIGDGHKTMSYIALKIPGAVGFFTGVLKSSIESAFDEISKGIKAAAEEKQRSLTKK